MVAEGRSSINGNFCIIIYSVNLYIKFVIQLIHSAVNGLYYRFYFSAVSKCNGDAAGKCGGK